MVPYFVHGKISTILCLLKWKSYSCNECTEAASWGLFVTEYENTEQLRHRLKFSSHCAELRLQFAMEDTLTKYEM